MSSGAGTPTGAERFCQGILEVSKRRLGLVCPARAIQFWLSSSLYQCFLGTFQGVPRLRGPRSNLARCEGTADSLNAGSLRFSRELNSEVRACIQVQLRKFYVILTYFRRILASEIKYRYRSTC